METFNYLEVVFTSDGSRNKEIDTRIGRPVTRGVQGGKAPPKIFFALPGKMCWT